MNTPKPEYADLTQESLERMLRRLAEPDVPQTLEARLLAAIPSAPPVRTAPCRRRSRPGAWGASAIAATILIAALVITTGYNPDRQTPIPTPDLNDRSPNTVFADQNVPRLDDTNSLGRMAPR